MKKTIVVTITNDGDYMTPEELIAAIRKVESELGRVSSVTPRIKAHGNKGDIYKVEGWIEADAEIQIEL